ncbi:hypothetical protein ABER23_33045 [Paenibacillus lautus]
MFIRVPTGGNRLGSPCVESVAAPNAATVRISSAPTVENRYADAVLIV